ncbi:unnamed protein product [Echinostoma caproni]|uniref:Transferase n=1 Tax=Echinostoma caproni TaxID=27848 RepID=A0A183A7M9_9TREM|nr:unnamed protein product [Echinostoma caproni]
MRLSLDLTPIRISGIKFSHHASTAVYTEGRNQSFINNGTALPALRNGYGVKMIDPAASDAPTEIYQELVRLNPRKSSGPDGVSSLVLQNAIGTENECGLPHVI